MREPETQHDLLKEIPSPTTRLWAGLCVILSIFVVFAAYSIREVRGLEDFQANVVQRNRKASLQLLRLQGDAYLLAVSTHDMAQASSKVPILDLRAEFARLRNDMSDAARQESQFAVSTPASDSKRAQLRVALADFGNVAGQVFRLAEGGREDAARELIQTELESKRAVISEIAARLLVLNDQAQVEAAERISAVYGSVKRQILIVIGALFLLALATGLYTFQANGKIFDRLRHLAERLQSQSEQLRKLSWKLIDIQEETLRQVARDLHDEFGQILTAIGMMLSRAERKTSPADSETLKDLKTVKNVVEDTLQNIRDRSQMFRPAVLDDFGLDRSLEWLVEQFSRQTGIEVHFEGQLTNGFFPREDAIHIYRIVQEALSNVARHSKAQSAWVSLRDSAVELSLEVRDNGIGFPVKKETPEAAANGIGLMSMRERAQHLNGTVNISSAPHGGTVVSVRVPLRKPVVETITEKAV